MVHMFHEKVNG